MNRHGTLDQTLQKIPPVQRSHVTHRIQSEPDLAFATSACVDADVGDSDELPPVDHVAIRHAYKPDQRADPHQFESSRRTHTPESCSSGESMKRQGAIDTPPESPINSTFSSSTDAPIGQLSLEPKGSTGQVNNCRGFGSGATVPATRCKRSASPRRTFPNKRSPGTPSQRCVQGDVQSDEEVTCPAESRDNRHQQHAARQLSGYHHTYGQTFAPGHGMVNGGQHAAEQKRVPVHQDSGYQSQPSRTHTLDQLPIPPSSAVVVSPSTLVSEIHGQSTDTRPRQHSPAPSHSFIKRRYPGITLQPNSSPISKDQLATEVKGIYNGLVTIEAKCISIDSGEAADPDSELSDEQWQALVALHRTLLYEHHDFLMATQHPSATPALRGLAVKYSMPARMWKHAIHAFLEVLRHRRPASQEYMMGFLILSYQMMTLLFETIPMFTDTWIECLGDLARYRMAIEEEREAQSIWGSVAARWYNTASDRHPAIGRLYHHLGILERLGLRKFFLFAKSLTCLIPFGNARDSLRTVCGPIIKGTTKGQQGVHSAEARIIAFHAFVFSRSDSAVIDKAASEALSRLSEQPAEKFRSMAVELIVTSVAGLMEFGIPSNRIWDLLFNAINAKAHASRPSAINTGLSSNQWNFTASSGLTSAPSTVYRFCYKIFDHTTSYQRNTQSLHASLPSVHTTLVWFHGVISLRSWTSGDNEDIRRSLLNTDLFSWDQLSRYLNALSTTQQISNRTIRLAREGKFPLPENEVAKPLPEDYSIRGLSWTHFYFPSDWFKGQPIEDSTMVETPSIVKCRIERVQWLGLYVSFHSEELRFDEDTLDFSAVAPLPETLPKCSNSRRTKDYQPCKVHAPVAPPSKVSPIQPRKTGMKISTKGQQDFTGIKIVDDGWTAHED